MSDAKLDTPADTSEKKPTHSGPTAPPSILTKPTDHAVRPGFRNPPKKGTKVQRGGRKK